MKLEILGIAASIIILIAMLFESTSIKGNIIMRSINIIGSSAFIVYGLLVPAYSTAFLNAATSIVNIVYIIKLVKKQLSDRSNREN